MKLQRPVFNHPVSIHEIFMTNLYIHVLVDEKGKANYNICVSDSAIKSESSDTAAILHLEKIIVNDSASFTLTGPAS
jgi:AsmA protein